MLGKLMGVIILSTLHVFSSKLNFATTVRYPHLGDILKSILAGFLTVQHMSIWSILFVLPPGNNCELKKKRTIYK